MGQIIHEDLLGFDSLKRWIRKYKPSEVSYRVILTNNIGESGETTLYNNGTFIVKLREDVSYQSLIDTFIHEIAHVFSLELDSRKDHSAKFWTEHGKIYEEYLKWINMRRRYNRG
jgi:hypothetical protein